MLGGQVPLSLLTDSKSLFDIIPNSSSTLEKLLMIDVAAARESYANEELSDIGLIRGEHNPSDALLQRIALPLARWSKQSSHLADLITPLCNGSIDENLLQICLIFHVQTCVEF
jgi:hypothetical protein